MPMESKPANLLKIEAPFDQAKEAFQKLKEISCLATVDRFELALVFT